jgi:hypothetical protein
MTYIAAKPGPEESHVAFTGQKEATMFRRILILAMLLPALGGCFFHGEGEGRGHHEHHHLGTR